MINTDSILGIARYYEPPDTTCDYLQAVVEPRNAVRYTADTTTFHFYNNIAHASSWHWDFGDGGTDSVQLPTHTYVNHGVYNVKVIVTYQHCTDTAYTTVYADPCSMLQNLVISPANDTLHLSVSGTINFTSSIQDANSYYWNFGDGTTSTIKNPTHTYIHDSLYTVMLVMQRSTCIDTAYTTVYVYPCDTVHLVISPLNDTVHIPVNGYVYFTSNIQDASIYYWTFGDGYHDYNTNPIHSYARDSVYTVRLVITEGECKDTAYSTITVIHDAGINEISNSLYTTISPNPATSVIQVNGNQSTVICIEIYNMLGDRIYNLPKTNYCSPFTINVSTLPAGMYFIEIKSEKGVEVKKFVKE
jgi:PKD repeat protein